FSFSLFFSLSLFFFLFLHLSFPSTGCLLLFITEKLLLSGRVRSGPENNRYLLSYFSGVIFREIPKPEKYQLISEKFTKKSRARENSR
ncbi:hypothetical protein Tsubulata_036924, partial [Turnera subulata]